MISWVVCGGKQNMQLHRNPVSIYNLQNTEISNSFLFFVDKKSESFYIFKLSRLYTFFNTIYTVLDSSPATVLYSQKPPFLKKEQKMLFLKFVFFQSTNNFLIHPTSMLLILKHFSENPEHIKMLFRFIIYIRQQSKIL